MSEKFDTLKKWLVDNSLWLAGLGLFIASSGIDGAYLVKLNEWQEIGGYALNTTSDIVGMLLMYWFGVFRQSANENKRKAAWGLVVSEIVTVAYSWLFSWRQYRMIIFTVETNPIGFTNEVEWLAFVFAGFIPLLLAFVGYAQGLQVSDMQTASAALSLADIHNPLDKIHERLDDFQKQIEKMQWPIANIQDVRRIVQGCNGSRQKLTPDKAGFSQLEKLLAENKLKMPANERTAQGWLERLQKGTL